MHVMVHITPHTSLHREMHVQGSVNCRAHPPTRAGRTPDLSVCWLAAGWSEGRLPG